MALNRSFRQIRHYVAQAKEWEAEKRLAANRVILTAQRAAKIMADGIEAEARRKVYDRDRAAYVAKQRDAGMAECPTCERWWPYSEIDAHIRGCNPWPQGS